MVSRMDLARYRFVSHGGTVGLEELDILLDE